MNHIDNDDLLPKESNGLQLPEICAMQENRMISCLALVNFLVLILVIVTSLCLGYNVTFPSPPKKPDMRQCMEDLFGKKTDSDTPKNIQDKVDTCNALLVDQETLDRVASGEFARYRQGYENISLLWLVICVTLSGIVLTIYQLQNSYHILTRKDIKLPHSTNQTKLKIGTAGLSVTSSVVGVVILTISFAFFWVYAKEIFPVISAGAENKESQKKETGGWPGTPEDQTNSDSQVNGNSN